jgi:PASTA domain
VLTAGNASAAAAPDLSWNQAITVLAIVAGLILATGLVVILGRTKLKSADPAPSLVRSWLALTLVAGLVVFCAVTLATSDTQLQSTVFGGLTASVGAAVAFYFSSKNADQARQDILNATFGTDTVPDIHGDTKDQAAAKLASSPFKLALDPNSSQDPTATVSKQDPLAKSVEKRGTAVVATLTVPAAGTDQPKTP